MRRIIALCMAILALVLVTATPANARPPANETVITLDSALAGTLPLAQVAADWSKNTDVTVVVAPCSGANCVEFSVVNSVCGNTVVINAPPGCAYRNADASCQNEIATYALTHPRLYAIVAHEVGHCLQSFGGAGFYHLTHERALMHATPTANRITNLDVKMVNGLY